MIYANSSQNKKAFVETMQKHVDALSNRDLKTLQSIIAPNGKMQLTLPKAPIIQGISGIREYLRECFKDSLWTYETKILNTEIGDRIGMVITEIIYREPETNGAGHRGKN